MHGPPEIRNPTAMARGGARKSIGLAGLINPEDSLYIAERQAACLVRRFGLPWPTARLIAAIAFTVEAPR